MGKRKEGKDDYEYLMKKIRKLENKIIDKQSKPETPASETSRSPANNTG